MHLRYLIVTDKRERGEIQLTTALEMAQAAISPDNVHFAYVCEILGQSHDIGVPISYANTVAAFARHI